MQRVGRIFRRGIVLAESAKSMLQVEGFEGERFDGVELWQQYGFSSRPPVGSEVLLGRPNGLRDDAVAFATNARAYRPTDLDEGEAAMYGPTGTACKASTDGTIHVGGNAELLAKGETLKTALDTFCTVVGALSTDASPAQNGLAIMAIVGAANTLKTSLATVLATKGKVS